ncbi:MAG: hypothetical protein QW666_04625 [Candidatus Woesearchaeota archaeon]
MKAVIVTAVVVVLILAIGIPIIHYATKSDESTISAKTLATGRAVQNTPSETSGTTPQQSSAEKEASAKEMLEQYKQQTTASTGPKTGYTINYLLNQSRTQQAATCRPLLDAAQKRLADAEAAVKSKFSLYEAASEKVNTLMDADADESKIDDARDDLEEAKKAYESALAAKYKASDDLVKIRIQCAGYLTK